MLRATKAGIIAQAKLWLEQLRNYLYRKPLTPDAIGGGPASVLEALPIEEAFFAHTLSCGHRCHRCEVCRNYYHQVLQQGTATPAEEKTGA